MAAILFDRKDIDAAPNSRLDQVVVYQGRAQIFRRLTAALKEGQQTVVFSALGREIGEENIKAKCVDARARVVSLTLDKKNLYFFNKKENEKLSREAVSALKNLIALCDRKTILAVESGLIGSLRQYLERALGDILLEQNVAITRLKEALDFLRDLLDRNRDDAVGADQELAAAEEGYGRLAAALEQIRRFDAKVTHEIRIEIESTASLETDIEISYTVRGASWQTSYDAALSDNGGKLSLSVFGEITQASGEDWEGARIALSSAETETGIAIPQIHPLNLSGYEEKIKNEIVTADEEISELGEEGGGGAQQLRPTGETAVEKKGTAYLFTLPRTESVPCDGLSHRFLIRRDELAPRLTYETIPAKMEYVYLKAAFANAGTAPLLPGRVMIYRNGSYIGRTALSYIAPGEEAALSFGIDLDIKVKRIVLKDKLTPARGAGLMRQRREFAYRYILSHFLSAPVKVVLKEAIHVSEVDKIKVQVEDKTTAGYKLDREGIVSFEVDIPAGSFKHTLLLLHYSIEAPKSVNLQNA